MKRLEDACTAEGTLFDAITGDRLVPEAATTHRIAAKVASPAAATGGATARPSPTFRFHDDESPYMAAAMTTPHARATAPSRAAMPGHMPPAYQTGAVGAGLKLGHVTRVVSSASATAPSPSASVATPSAARTTSPAVSPSPSSYSVRAKWAGGAASTPSTAPRAGLAAAYVDIRSEVAKPKVSASAPPSSPVVWDHTAVHGSPGEWKYRVLQACVELSGRAVGHFTVALNQLAVHPLIAEATCKPEGLLEEALRDIFPTSSISGSGSKKRLTALLPSKSG